jgi:hypothetical protein
MTKIIKKTKKEFVQSHYDSAFKIIDEHLPSRYVLDVQKKVNKTYSDGNVRSRGNPITNSNIKILNALVELALENKEDKEKLTKITN